MSNRQKSIISNFSERPRKHARTGDDPDALALGDTARSARIQAGLTQDQLALTSGVGRDTIMAIENGRGSVGLGKALRVLKALGLRIVPQERS
ncbi:helix-turn-helix domain-containing protein [Dyella subtropica]|uniref:helix-turn-helix domain-containing protein n=1 Tax=Dyella subtropica TaxID=2992127 RepID=UPI002251FD53|nr:helix-turn-helix domain-containing protein [Dyella subtropica]